MHTNEEYENVEVNEEDYSDFYNVEEEEDKNNNNDNKKKKIIVIVVILAVILIALVVVLFLIFGKKKPIDFNLNFEKQISGEWSKDNITINVDVPDEKDLKSIKYTINCNDNCDYVDVTDKKILISNNGSSVVTVIVTNVDDVENKKDITVKIDNVAPELSLTPANKDIKSNGSVTVCAECKDNDSGCKQEKVCKEYTKTSKDQTLTVEDNVGNKTTSNKFNVTITNNNNQTKTNTQTKTNPETTPDNLSCSLSVNADGLITAKYEGANAYHGFSSNYSGTNENTKQLSSTEKRTGAKVIYYVKNNDGRKYSCNIQVSCPCEYRSDDLTCYREVAKEIKDPKSSECTSASGHTAKHNSNGCLLLKNEGSVCKKS